MPSLFSGFAANTTLRYRSAVHIDIHRRPDRKRWAGPLDFTNSSWLYLTNPCCLHFTKILKTLVNDLINYKLRSLYAQPRAPGRG